MIHLALHNVTTNIGNKTIVENISFEGKAGEIVALVGHNGAGKSTVLKTIMGMLEKSSGEITIKGMYTQTDHLLQFKQNLAYLPEEPLLLSELTVFQHFQVYARAYNIKESLFKERSAYYVEHFDLKEQLHKFPEELSKGMRQKAQAICVLLPDVPVLLIDEPFMGLDIYAQAFIKDAIRNKCAQGTTVLLTTHQLDVLQELADTFVILENGHIQSSGNIEQFETISRGQVDNDS